MKRVGGKGRRAVITQRVRVGLNHATGSHAIVTQTRPRPGPPAPNSAIATRSLRSTPAASLSLPASLPFDKTGDRTRETSPSRLNTARFEYFPPPVRRPTPSRAMLDSGLSDDGAAQALGWPKARVTARVQAARAARAAQQMVGDGQLALQLGRAAARDRPGIPGAARRADRLPRRRQRVGRRAARPGARLGTRRALRERQQQGVRGSSRPGRRPRARGAAARQEDRSGCTSAPSS